MVEGPTNEQGEVTVPWADIQAKAEWHVNTSPMDFSHPADFTGVIVAQPMAISDLDAALQGYRSWRGAFPHSPNYIDQITWARAKLDKIGPVELTVEVKHDGQDVWVKCKSAPV